jgi:hypothetical protein
MVLFNRKEIPITEDQKMQIDQAIKDGKDGMFLNNKPLNFKMIAHFEEEAEGMPQMIAPKKTIKSVTANWCKKIISKKDWNDFYSKVGSYCWLSANGNDVFIGLFIPAINGDLTLPSDCYALTDSELLQIQRYRESNNIFPQPFAKKVSEEVEEETNNAFDNLRERLNFRITKS